MKYLSTPRFLILFSLSLFCIFIGESYVATVSGLSSGAFMAVQYHVAHSASVIGAGIVSGGPYYCALDNIAIAMSSCMKDPWLINNAVLETATYEFAASKLIDPVSNLQTANILLFHGTKDTAIKEGVVNRLYSYYTYFFQGYPNEIEYIDNIPAVHSMVTNFYGNPCDVGASPGIVNCNYDLAGKILKKVYQKHAVLNPPSANMTGYIYTINTKEYLKPVGYTLETASLYNETYAYIPKGCGINLNKTQNCKIHVVFHGCLQSVEEIGMDYVMNTGYNFWADTNQIIILYPQIKKTVLNEGSCFDWYGYTLLIDYPTKIAPQIATIDNIISSLFENQNVV